MIDKSELIKWAQANYDGVGPLYAKPYWREILLMLRQSETCEDFVEQTCQKLCRHFENLARAEADGGGELWYGELEMIVKDALRPTPAGWQDKYIVWDDKHLAWWRPNGVGYTNDKAEAGLYTAREIAERNEQLSCRRLSPHLPPAPEQKQAGGRITPFNLLNAASNMKPEGE